MGMRSCKALHEAKRFMRIDKGFSVAELATLGTLGSVLTALEKLTLVASRSALQLRIPILRHNAVAAS